MDTVHIINKNASIIDVLLIRNMYVPISIEEVEYTIDNMINDKKYSDMLKYIARIKEVSNRIYYDCILGELLILNVSQISRIQKKILSNLNTNINMKLHLLDQYVRIRDKYRWGNGQINLAIQEIESKGLARSNLAITTAIQIVSTYYRDISNDKYILGSKLYDDLLSSVQSNFIRDRLKKIGFSVYEAVCFLVVI